MTGRAQLNVAMIAVRSTPWRGGVETHVYELATALARRNINVTVHTHTTAQPGDPPEGTDHTDGVTWRRWRTPMRGNWYIPSARMLANIRRAATAGHIDIVHTHQYHRPVGPLAIAAAAGKTPSVFTGHYHGNGHTPLANAAHPAWRAATGQLLRRLDTYIAVSPSEADLWTAHFGHLDADTYTIANGTRTIPVREPLDKTGPVVVTIGRLEPYKRIDRLIQAITPLSDTTLVIIGDGNDRARLESVADTAGVSARVRFTGNIDNHTLERWIATADAYATYSSREAFGLTICEARSAGVPVVASDIPAHGDVQRITGGDPAWIQLVTDEHDLTGAIRRAIALGRSPGNPPDWDQVAEMTETAYRETIARHRAKHLDRQRNGQRLRPDTAVTRPA